MKKENLIKGIVVILTMVVLVVGFFHFKKQEIPEIKESSTNWKTYKDEKYGFTFKVPKEWKVERGHENKTGLILLYDGEDKEQFSISVAQNGKDQEEFKGLCFDQNSEICNRADQGVIIFNAGTGFVYSVSRDQEERRLVILSNKRLTFSLNNDSGGDVKTIDEIINSFKVSSEWRDIDEFNGIRGLLDGEYKFSSISTDKWTNYQNREAGFEIKIPEGWNCEETLFQMEGKYKQKSQGFLCIANEECENNDTCDSMTLLVKPGFYHTLTAEPVGFVPFDANLYYSIASAKYIAKRNDFLSKSFKSNNIKGLIIVEGKNRTAWGNYEDKAISIIYTNRSGYDEELFDGILRSFRVLE